MLRSLKDLEDYTVEASDGDIGTTGDFLLDDERWVIRYLVVQTSGSVGRRGVLVTPTSFRRADWSNHRFHLALTLDKIRNSPGIDIDQPVSRQHETDYYRYFGYPYYWGDRGLWGMEASPRIPSAIQPEPPATSPGTIRGDVHLRSARAVRGYHLQGIDGQIGHVEDFIVDDETWQIRFLVIDTSNWWFGKKVLISPNWVSRVSWEDRKVIVDVSRRAVENSPPWDATDPVNHEYEVRLYDYYGRPLSWDKDEHRQTGRSDTPPELR